MVKGKSNYRKKALRNYRASKKKTYFKKKKYAKKSGNQKMTKYLGTPFPSKLLTVLKWQHNFTMNYQLGTQKTSEYFFANDPYRPLGGLSGQTTSYMSKLLTLYSNYRVCAIKVKAWHFPHDSTAGVIQTWTDQYNNMQITQPGYHSCQESGMVGWKEFYTYNQGTAKCQMKKYFNFKKLFNIKTNDRDWIGSQTAAPSKLIACHIGFAMKDPRNVGEDPLSMQILFNVKFYIQFSDFKNEINDS